jgi:hypothetical protein
MQLERMCAVRVASDGLCKAWASISQPHGLKSAACGDHLRGVLQAGVGDFGA